VLYVFFCYFFHFCISSQEHKVTQNTEDSH